MKVEFEIDKNMTLSNVKVGDYIHHFEKQFYFPKE